MLTLSDILDARERRAEERAKLQTGSGKILVSLSLNMPGQEKNSSRARQLFQAACARVREEFVITQEQSVYGKTGPYGFFLLDIAAGAAKKAALRMEEETAWSRLWDIDIYDKHGQRVGAKERPHGRRCLLCDQPAFACMREGRHNSGELAARVDELFVAFYAASSRNISPAAEQMGALALEAVLYEVACGPKPGLVDPFHNGSHQDMDFFTFQRSSAALAHYFARFAEAGLRHEGGGNSLLPVLRTIGLEAETAMFAATGGVNTQKGLIFSLGLTLGASGLLARGEKALTTRRVAFFAKKAAAGLVVRELAGGKSGTAGRTAYNKFAATGARGEAEAGFPAVRRAGLPALERALTAGLDINKSLLHALFALVTVTGDTTILARGRRMDALRWVQKAARFFIKSDRLAGASWRDELDALDKEFCRRNLSPGGAADLLALTWYLHKINGRSFPVF